MATEIKKLQLRAEMHVAEVRKLNQYSEKKIMAPTGTYAVDCNVIIGGLSFDEAHAILGVLQDCMKPPPKSTARKIDLDA
jgi:hypothetical protein